MAPDRRRDVQAEKGSIISGRRPPNGTKVPRAEDRSADEKPTWGIGAWYHNFMDRHPFFRSLLEKLEKDNIGMLAGYVSWSILTSTVPIIVGLLAITALFLRDPGTQQTVIDHLANATQGAFGRREIGTFVHASTQHTGFLGLVGAIGVLWGGSNIGGAISTAFEAVFEVSGRSFMKEKLIDVGMIVVFAVLMLIIIAGTSAGALLSGLVTSVPVPRLAWVIGTLASVLSALLLFGTIYLVFPNIKPPFRFNNVWKGATLSAIMFTVLSQIWPLYAGLQHFGKYGKLLAPLLILTAWIYFFSVIVMVGAEVVAVAAIEEAKQVGQEIGPPPEETVPQHEVLRDQPVAEKR